MLPANALTLARLEFAVTTATHFMFVMLTLGLVTQVALMQTRWVRTGRPVYERSTRFWGQLYVINYALGIATGLVMEFQLGLNWSGLGRITGDVFGAPLAMETLVAFFLESTLLGMWIFGWGTLRPRLHLALIWGVVATAYASAFFVMVANSFLQHPVGYAIGPDGRARLTDAGALLANPNLWAALAHLLSAALLAGGLVIAGISAWHLLRGHPDTELFHRGLRRGVLTGLAGAFATVGFGFAQFSYLGDQPTKLAGGAEAAAAQAAMAAAHGPGHYLPPTWVGAAADAMIGVGQLLLLVLLAVAPLLIRGLLGRSRRLRPVLWLLVALMPVPFLTAVLGWLVREVGRQPWIVYGVLRTADAVSPIPPGALLASATGFALLVGGLVVADLWLLARYARRGPGTEFLPDPVAQQPPAPALVGG